MKCDVEYYNNNRGIYSPVIEHNGIIIGFWLCGQDYHNETKYYGAYPPSYMKRMQWLFHDDFEKGKIMHLFSGMIKSDNENITTVDISESTPASYHIDASDIDIHFCDNAFDLVMSDPPYGQNHVKYGTQPINRRNIVKKCAIIVKPGGHLVWLDTIIPMWAKADGWKLRGTIGMVQSTNHQCRVITILEKV